MSVCSECQYKGNIKEKCFKFVDENDRGKYRRREFYFISSKIAGVVKGGSYLLCKILKEALKDNIERQFRVSDYEGGFKEGNKVYCFNHEDEDLPEIKSAQKELATKDYKKSFEEIKPDARNNERYLEFLLNHEAKERFGLSPVQEGLLLDVMDNLAFFKSGRLSRRLKSRREFITDAGILTSKAVDFLVSDQSRFSYLYETEQSLEFSIGNSEVVLVNVQPLKYGRLGDDLEAKRSAVFEVWRKVKEKLKKRIDFKHSGIKYAMDALESTIFKKEEKLSC